jgi:hypothetical protein
MSKKHGKWRGRPNEPPLNWHAPGRPVIRKVSGGLGDALPPSGTGDDRANVPKKASRSVDNPPPAPWPAPLPSPLPAPLPAPSPRDHSGLIAVTLESKHWETIIRALQFYGETHGDADWRKWWLQVRGAMLAAVNINTHGSKPVAVNLEIEDWRSIWQQLCITCQERGDNRVTWFDWLSRTMTQQIKEAS